MTIHPHLQLGAMDEVFLQNALSMKVEAALQIDTVTVNVSIVNDNTGHHVPTGSPLRHLILLVRAFDSDNNTLALVDGSVLPEWCGTDSLSAGHYSGLAGKTFAKILEELWTGVSPTGAYWNHTRLVSDNRIVALETDKSSYTFSVPDSGTTQVDVKLIFRRAFIELAEQKGWEQEDIIMARKTITLSE